jgi:lambda family phage tail tape measure protein
MTGPIPNVGVKFTAEDGGVSQAIRELVAQLRGLNREADKTDQATRKVSRGFDTMANTIRDVAAVIGLVRLAGLGKELVNTAEQVGRVSEQSGASVETLSALAVVGQTSGVSIEQLGQAFLQLNKTLVAARNGSGEAAAGLRAVGLTVEELSSLSADEAIRRVVTALAKLPNGAIKSAAAMKLFGRSGAELIPLLNDLGDKGIGGAIDKARELGLLLDNETVRSAKEFNDSLSATKLALAGVAAAMARDILPVLTDFANLAAKAITALPDDVKRFALALLAVAAAAYAARTAILVLNSAMLRNPFTLAAVGLSLVVAKLIELAGAAARAKSEYAAFLGTLTTESEIATERNRLENAKTALAFEIRATTHTGRRNQLLKEQKRLEEQLQALAGREREITTPAAGLGDGDNEALLRARLAARVASARSEQQVEEARSRAFQQLNQAQYDAGLQSLASYYNRRLGLTRDAVNAEIEALRAQRAALEASPVATPAEGVQRRSQIQQIDSQIEQRQITGETEERQLLEDRARAERALGELRLGYEVRVQEAKGNTLSVALLAIEREAVEYRKLLQQFGVTGDDQDAAVAAFTSVLNARAQFEKVQAEIQQVFAQIERERTRIAAEVQIGVLTELQGQRAIADVETARLPLLQQMVDQARALALAMGNPELVATTADWNAQLVALAASADLAAQEAARFRANLETSVSGDISQFLGHTITEVDSLADAFLSLAESVVQSIRRIVSELLAAQITRGLFGLLTAGGNGTNWFSGAFADGFAEGGYTGAGAKYEPAGIVHRGEFVVNAQQTSQHRGLLQAINDGGFTMRAIRGYAEGGFVGGMAGDLVSPTAKLSGRITVAAEPGSRVTETEGEFLGKVHRYQRGVRQALGIRQ